MEEEKEEEIPELIDTELLVGDPVKQIIDDIVSNITGLSFTAIKHFRDSPKDFIDYKMKTKVQTPAMIYGGMLHCLVWEPDAFESRYLAFDDTAKFNELKEKGQANPRATKDYKLWKQDQLAQAGKRIVITPQEFQHAKIVARNVRYNRASARIIEQCPIHEQVLEWEAYNFKWKGFIDGQGENIVCDLKSLPDAHPDKFKYKLKDEALALQAVMYLQESNRQFYWIAVDKLGGVSVHYCKKSWIEWGKREYDRLMLNFNDCIIRDAWDQSYDFWAPYWNGIYDAEKPAFM